MALLWCELSSLVRSNAVLATMSVDKAFFKSIDGDFGFITCKKSKSITRITIYSSKNKAPSLLQRKWSKAVNLQQGHWLASPGNDALSEAQCWSLLLADLAISSSCSQDSPGEWKSMLLSPCIDHISATMDTLFTGPLGNKGMAEERS